jgi:hypothetical protein
MDIVISGEWPSGAFEQATLIARTLLESPSNSQEATNAQLVKLIAATVIPDDSQDAAYLAEQVLAQPDIAALFDRITARSVAQPNRLDRVGGATPTRRARDGTPGTPAQPATASRAGAQTPRFAPSTRRAPEGDGTTTTPIRLTAIQLISPDNRSAERRGLAPEAGRRSGGSPDWPGKSRNDLGELIQALGGRENILSGLERARIGGLLVPSFGPGDEFYGDDEGDGEGDLGEALVGVAVGVAS